MTESYRDRNTGMYHFMQRDIEEMYIQNIPRRMGFLNDLDYMVKHGKAVVEDA